MKSKTKQYRIQTGGDHAPEQLLNVVVAFFTFTSKAKLGARSYVVARVRIPAVPLLLLCVSRGCCCAGAQPCSPVPEIIETARLGRIHVSNFLQPPSEALQDWLWSSFGKRTFQRGYHQCLPYVWHRLPTQCDTVPLSHFPHNLILQNPNLSPLLFIPLL